MDAGSIGSAIVVGVSGSEKRQQSQTGHRRIGELTGIGAVERLSRGGHGALSGTVGLSIPGPVGRLGLGQKFQRPTDRLFGVRIATIFKGVGEPLRGQAHAIGSWNEARGLGLCCSGLRGFHSRWVDRTLNLI